jgi:hypothetical protein
MHAYRYIRITGLEYNKGVYHVFTGT